MIDPGEVPFRQFPRVFLEAYAESWGTRHKFKSFEERPVPSEMFLAGDVHETCLSIALGQIAPQDGLLMRNAVRLARATSGDDTYLTWDCIAEWMANAAVYAGFDRWLVAGELEGVGEAIAAHKVVSEFTL